MLALVSIIVPVYNVERYLKRCVDSILNQTFTDFELILVDDESTDDSGKICDRYAEQDNRIVVIHKKNGGVSSARNAGLDAAVGEYIAFCDSDDYVLENWLIQMTDKMVNHKVDSVVSNWQLVDENDQVLRVTSFEEGIKYISDEKDKISYYYEVMFSGKTSWSAWCRLFRADIIKKEKIYFSENCENYAEDLGFVLEYTLYCKNVMCISDSGYRYVKHKGSIIDKNQNIIKLNSLNEVSKNFNKCLERAVSKSTYKKHFPVLNFLIMNTEYSRMISKNILPLLGECIDEINDKVWYRKATRKIFSRYNVLKKAFGDDYARRILLFSHYCLHKNYTLYGKEWGIFNKIFSK